MAVTATDPAPYLAAARCTFSCVPAGLIGYVNLAVLIDIINGDPVPTDTNELLNKAKCLRCEIPPGVLPYATLQALVNVAAVIAAGGGSGGAQEVYSPIPAAPDDPTKPALAYDAPSGNLLQWDGANWV